MRKKKEKTQKQEITKRVPTYTCQWCKQEKITHRNFFKCSIEHGVFICCDCIKEKYNQLCTQCEKALAILICCHYLNIRFSLEVVSTMKDSHSFGDYIRLYNLRQNTNLNFADGLLTGNDISIGKDVNSKVSWKYKTELSKIIDDLTKVKNEL